jgi:hypothetical protein
VDDKIQKIIEMVSSSVNEKINLEQGENAFWNLNIKNYKNKPIEEWTLRDFVLHYKDIFLDVKQEDYIITYTVDTSEMQKIKSSISKLGYTKKTDLKDFLDWCKDNKNEILEKRPSFMIHDLAVFINSYITEKKAPKIETPRIPDDNEFISRLRKKIIDGTNLQLLLETYGIPVTATFLCNIFDKEQNVIESNIEKVIYTLFNRKRISSINKAFKQSINLSPYHEEFIMLDWRDKFEEVCSKINIRSENWWRDTDYTSILPSHYGEILDYGRKSKSGNIY